MLHRKLLLIITTIIFPVRLFAHGEQIFILFFIQSIILIFLIAILIIFKMHYLGKIIMLLVFVVLTVANYFLPIFNIYGVLGYPYLYSFYYSILPVLGTLLTYIILKKYVKM